MSQVHSAGLLRMGHIHEPSKGVEKWGGAWLPEHGALEEEENSRPGRRPCPLPGGRDRGWAAKRRKCGASALTQASLWFIGNAGPRSEHPQEGMVLVPLLPTVSPDHPGLSFPTCK